MDCPKLAELIEKKTDPSTVILGKGSQGIVYRIGDYVLKQVIFKDYLQDNPDKDANDKKSSFKLEANILLALNNNPKIKPFLPYLCAVDYSAEDKGYILQRYEPTITLLELIQTTPKGTLNFDIGYSIYRNLSKALLEIIKAGYLHRDIKPENILIRTKSAEEMKKPIFIDFGIACPIDLATGSCKKGAINAFTKQYMIKNFLPPSIHGFQPKMTITKNGTPTNVYVKTGLIPIYYSKDTDFYALALTLEEFMPIIDFTGHTKEMVEMHSFIQDRKKTIFLNTLKKRRQKYGPLQVVESLGTRTNGGRRNKRKTQKKRRASK